jgi:hypothetical protein
MHTYIYIHVSGMVGNHAVARVVVVVRWVVITVFVVFLVVVVALPCLWLLLLLWLWLSLWLRLPLWCCDSGVVALISLCLRLTAVSG